MYSSLLFIVLASLSSVYGEYSCGAPDYVKPHESDCRFYYSCIGEEIRRACPADLSYFDPVSRVCVANRPSGCVDGSVLPTPREDAMMRCTRDDNHVRDWVDCSKFYQCDHRGRPDWNYWYYYTADRTDCPGNTNYFNGQVCVVKPYGFCFPLLTNEGLPCPECVYPAADPSPACSECEEVYQEYNECKCPVNKCREKLLSCPKIEEVPCGDCQSLSFNHDSCGCVSEAVCVEAACPPQQTDAQLACSDCQEVTEQTDACGCTHRRCICKPCVLPEIPECNPCQTLSVVKNECDCVTDALCVNQTCPDEREPTCGDCEVVREGKDECNCDVKYCEREPIPEKDDCEYCYAREITKTERGDGCISYDSSECRERFKISY